MTPKPAKPVLIALLAAAFVLTGCATVVPSDAATVAPADRAKPRQHPASEPAEPPVALTNVNRRKSRGVVAAGGADAPYNYGPSVMIDGDGKRMWWCSQYGKAKPAGDDILHGSAKELAGPFTSSRGRKPAAVFSGSRKGFDGMHTCDPSVIKVKDVYYLYYTGAKGDHQFGNAIGVATSKDGLRWRRANGGEPIVKPSKDAKRENAYGAGQPAAVFLDGWYYLMFTDTTGGAAGWNGAGQFLLRSRDPLFGSDVEALGPKGFAEVSSTAAARRSSLADAFSADLMWVEVLDAFAVAHQTGTGTTLTFWDRGFTVNPHPPVTVAGPWREGPGLARTPWGHAPISAGDPCGTVPIDVLRATKNVRAPTGIRHFGMDLTGAHGCADPARALALLEGHAFPSPERTMDLITDGKLVRVDRRSVAVTLARSVLKQRPDPMAELAVDARLTPEVPVLYSPGSGPGVLLDDGRLWPLRDASVADAMAKLNGSRAKTVSDHRLASYPAGPTLG
ncbi:MAG: beta-xylosidase [Actinophytocola sp.]|nr:beta-xylosidase [Actinophytocola sp.]